MNATCPNCGTQFEVETGEMSPLRKARLVKGVSIAVAANEVGMSHWALSRLERGDGNPKLSVLKSISTYYDKPIDELFPQSPTEADDEEDDEDEEDEVPDKVEGK